MACESSRRETTRKKKKKKKRGRSFIESPAPPPVPPSYVYLAEKWDGERKYEIEIKLVPFLRVQLRRSRDVHLVENKYFKST